MVNFDWQLLLIRSKCLLKQKFITFDDHFQLIILMAAIETYTGDFQLELAMATYN